MRLESGAEIGAYEILALLGSGGMGEVYRARDRKLGRDVALKVLPEVFARDQERMARFTREAQLLASLNHPNIAAIYGVEESAGRFALVLELVDGETLAERIAKGPIQLERALNIALQIAEALEAAHEKSIIHRDLKPANVKFTSQGTVKVLDFGLAKALADEPALSSTLSQSPTLSLAATGAGVILGTAGYMAPEQARGKPADRRSDIWAFGVLLFEMLTARRAFDGETVSDTLAKILERDPDWNLLPPGTPLAVRKLLQRCMTKNAKDRLQAIGDSRTLIQEMLADPSALSGNDEDAVRPFWRKVLPWVFAPLFVAAGWWIKPSAVPVAPGVFRTEYMLPGGQVLFHQFRHAVAMSPQGDRFAFTATPLASSAQASIGGSAGLSFSSQPKIYLKSLDGWDVVQIPGTENGIDPFFSPDGQSVAFVQLSGGIRALKKVTLAGGAPVLLVEKLGAYTGATWGPNGTIVFSPDVVGGLKSVSDAGGEIRDFTELNKTANEVSHRLPHFLPDGSAVLFTATRYSRQNRDWKWSQLWVKSLKTGERKLLLEEATDGQVVANRYLVFAQEGKLLAVRFDTKSLSVLGSPVPVLDGVTHSLRNTTVNTNTGAAQYSVSDNGSLIYAPGSIEPAPQRTLLWVNRKEVTPVGIKPGAYASVWLSRDSRRILLSDNYSRDIGIFDTKRLILDRFTVDGTSTVAVLSRDGNRVAFNSDQTGPRRVYVGALNSRDATPITPGPDDTPASWTPDGKELAFVHGDPEDGSSSYDISVVAVDSPNKILPLLNDPKFNETHPDFSPDGEWLAYASDRNARREVYVQPYPGPGPPVLIGGGMEPAWSREGNELFFREGAKMMSVRFRISGNEFIPEKPVVLFEGRYGAGAIVRFYDVAPDGRFLMVQDLPEDAERGKKIFPSTLRIVLNWVAELDRLFAR